MRFGNNAPEVFRSQFIVVIRFDEKTYNGLPCFEINLNIVLGKMAGIQKLSYLVIGHGKNLCKYTVSAP